MICRLVMMSSSSLSGCHIKWMSDLSFNTTQTSPLFNVSVLDIKTRPHVKTTYVTQHAKIWLFSQKWESHLLCYSTRGCLEFSFDILFMFVGHTNAKLCVLVNAIFANLSKINVPSKRQMKIEILHNLKEF